MFAIGTLKFTIYAPFRRQWLHVHAVRQCLRSTSCSHIEKKMFWWIPMATCHPTGYLRAQVTQNKPRKILLKIQDLQQKMPSTSRWFFLFWYILVNIILILQHMKATHLNYIIQSPIKFKCTVRVHFRNLIQY